MNENINIIISLMQSNMDFIEGLGLYVAGYQ